MKRAVAYIRVSTASDAQVHSFEFQEDYWKNEINKNDDLTLVEIYADKGISGKSLSKRPELKRLLRVITSSFPKRRLLQPILRSLKSE